MPPSLGFQLDLFRLVVYYNGQDVPFGEIEEWHGMRNFYSDEDQGWRGVSPRFRWLLRTLVFRTKMRICFSRLWRRLRKSTQP